MLIDLNENESELQSTLQLNNMLTNINPLDNDLSDNSFIIKNSVGMPN